MRSDSFNFDMSIILFCYMSNIVFLPTIQFLWIIGLIRNSVNIVILARRKTLWVYEVRWMADRLFWRGLPPLLRRTQRIGVILSEIPRDVPSKKDVYRWISVTKMQHLVKEQKALLSHADNPRASFRILLRKGINLLFRLFSALLPQT